MADPPRQTKKFGNYIPLSRAHRCMGPTTLPLKKWKFSAAAAALSSWLVRQKGKKSPDLLAHDLPSSLPSTQRRRSPHRRSATRRRPWPQSPPVLVCLHLNFPPCLKFFRSSNSRSKSNFFCRLCPSMSRKGRRT